MNMPPLPPSLFGRSSRGRHHWSPAAEMYATSAVSLCCQTMLTWTWAVFFILTNWKKKLSTLGLKWIEECDSKSLCSPCAMLYHWLYKGFIIDQLAPSSGSYGEWSAAQRHCTTTFFNAEVSPAGPPGVLPLLLQGGQCTEAWWCQL